MRPLTRADRRALLQARSPARAAPMPCERAAAPCGELGIAAASG